MNLSNAVMKPRIQSEPEDQPYVFRDILPESARRARRRIAWFNVIAVIILIIGAVMMFCEVVQ